MPSFMFKLNEVFVRCERHPTEGVYVGIVDTGDSLGMISFHVTGDANRVQELEAVNPDLTAASMLQPGDEVRIPLHWTTDDDESGDDDAA